MKRETLVTLDHDGGRAEVARDRSGTWLVGSVEHGGGTEIRADRRLALEGVGGGRFVVGGLLPAGATSAVAIAPTGEPVAARCGGGAWLAVVAAPDWEEPPVRFDDDAGRPVRPALPAAWPREPVPDADVPCPACGATTWERVTPTDFSRGSHRRGGGPEEPAAVIVCVRCGHEEREGAWFAAGPGAPDHDEIARHLERRRRERDEALRGVDFTVYALADGPAPELSGWGCDMRRVTEITLRHGGEVEVTSTRPDGGRLDNPLDRARDAFFASAGQPSQELPELSQPARTLWLRARERERIAALMGARPASVDVAVDGVPVPFTAFRAGANWAMAANLDGAQVTVTATNRPLESIALRALPNLAGEVTTTG